MAEMLPGDLDRDALTGGGEKITPYLSALPCTVCSYSLIPILRRGKLRHRDRQGLKEIPQQVRNKTQKS